MQPEKWSAASINSAFMSVTSIAQFENLIRFYRDIGYRAGEMKRFPSLPSDVLFVKKPLRAIR